MLSAALLVILALAAAGYMLSRRKAVAAAGGRPASLHSRPSYHGLWSLLWVLIAGLGTFFVLDLAGQAIISRALRSLTADLAPAMPDIERMLVISDARQIAGGALPSTTGELRGQVAARFAKWETIRVWTVAVLSVVAAAGALWWTRSRIDRDFRARNRAEQLLRTGLWAMAAVAVVTTIAIVLSLIGETLVFFREIGWQVDAFLFGTNWSPLAGVHEGVIDPARVGALPLFLGTLMITVIAMLVAVPIGLFAAIYLSDFAPARVRAWGKPLLEILAGIPTVVYGYFAAVTVAPAIRDLGEAIGLDVASESALAAGLVMGIMIIPFISSLSDDVINAVPQSLRDGSFGLGATRAETMRTVVLPAALPGIVSAVLLGISRAVGETMIVVMAAGQGANLTWNPLEAVTTVTVQIVMLITGDVEAETAAGPAFTLGFTLFCVTLALNIVALRVVRRYREIYE